MSDQKLNSADHKVILTSTLQGGYDDFRHYDEAGAQKFVREFGYANLVDLLSAKKWKRVSKRSAQLPDGKRVDREFQCGEVKFNIEEWIQDGETMPYKTVLQLVSAPIELRPLMSRLSGASTTIEKSADGPVTVGKIGMTGLGPAESMLSTPKPEGFGAFG